MSLNLAVGNDECIVLVILLAVSRAVLKSYGGGGGWALIRRKTQEKRFLNRVYNAFSLQSLAHAIRPEALPAIHRWLKHQNGTGKLHFRFFRFSDPRRGKATVCTFHR